MISHRLLSAASRQNQRATLPRRRIRHSRSTAHPDRRGAAILEVAICFPIFMLILLGIVEFGRAMNVAQLLTNSAREGARVAILDGSTNEEVIQAVQTMTVNTVGCTTQDVTVTVTCTDVNTGTAIADVANAERRDLIEVEVSVPFDRVSYGSGNFLSGKPLTGQCVMRHE